MPKTRRILITSALPYANGHIHLGHLVEYIQTDIFARFQRLCGNEAIYLCADDTHGTAIMIRAQAEGRTEQELIASMRDAHLADFEGFHIAFDHYGSTDSEENRSLCNHIWQSLRKQNLVTQREVSQLFDLKAGIFLADRFVQGGCPRCQAANQYGDSCETCGATYSPAELTNPISTLSGTKPEIRKAEHLFVTLESFRSFLTKWTQESEALDPKISNYLAGHFLNEPLRDWDISRPAPYFGFEIPDAPGTIGMSGLMHLSAISLPPNSGRKNMGVHLLTGGALGIQTSPVQKFTTSLEKTSPTFTHCSGRQCLKLRT